MLNNLIEVLRHLEIVLKLASSEDATLLKADMLMKVCLNKLSNKDNPLAVSMKECLLDRYLSRRHKDVVSLLRYLTNPETEDKTGSSNLLPMASRQVIKSFAKQAIFRLFPNEIKNIEIEDDSMTTVTSDHKMQDEAMDNDLLSQYMKELEKLELPTEPNFWKPVLTGFQNSDYLATLITPQHIKHNSKSLDVVQSLYFGSKLLSSGTYKYIFIYIKLYLYVPDEGSLLPKYRYCTTSNDFELHIYIYIHITQSSWNDS